MIVQGYAVKVFVFFIYKFSVFDFKAFAVPVLWLITLTLPVWSLQMPCT